MLKLTVILLLLPLYSLAKIKLSIVTAATLRESSVTYTGDDRRIVTDLDVELFNLTIDNIKYGVRKELGRYPENVFMKDPTTYGNVYKKFHWQPVTRRMTIEKAEILDIIDEPVAIKARTVKNNTTQKITKKIAIYDIVENTAYSAWSPYGVPVDNIEYDVNIFFKSVNQSFNYTNTWRNGTYRNKYIEFGANKPGYMIVDPGDSVIITLNAFKSIMLVEITYSASMIGSFLADYEELQGIHYHFWSPSVFNIMKAANFYKDIKTKELIEIRFFTDPQLVLARKDDSRTVDVVTPLTSFRIRNRH